MNVSMKNLLSLMSLILIYKISFFTGQVLAQTINSQNTTESTLFDIQFIMDNELFTLKEVYFDNFEDNIRNCVFESPSAVWTIKHCHEGKITIEGAWYLVMAGDFSIKNTDTKLSYYLERESHIYKNIKNGSLAFTRYLSLQRVQLVDGDDNKVDIGWSQKRLPFLQTLARVQEQLIEQSLTENPEVEQGQTTYSERKAEPIISDMQNILDNEQFTLKEVYFNGFKDNIRNCVFESPSAVWTIKYCHIGKLIVEGYWTWVMAGNFLIKNTNIELPYYIERGYRSIYKDIEERDLAFLTQRASIPKVIKTDEMEMDIDWTEKTLPFLKTLAKMQEQLIRQSVAEKITEAEAILANIESVMNNEPFVLREVKFSGSDDWVRSCVFESHSTIWVVDFCHNGKAIKTPDWSQMLQGKISIKNIDLVYYIRQKNNIYRDIETSSVNLTYPDYMYIEVDGNIKVGVNFFQTQLPFLQTLAQIQEQLIEQSLVVNTTAEDTVNLATEADYRSVPE